MRGEFVIARTLAEAGVPYGLGDLRVSNPDFLLADGAGGGAGPVAGVEVTAVSPKGIAELCELVESEGGLGDVRVSWSSPPTPRGCRTARPGRSWTRSASRPRYWPAAARRAMRWSRSRTRRTSSR
ncbi:hypothetical protein OG978_01190 [Streptomyces sp. NBC_01591]|uniref:hypothetical protein n=1 Tax=Streptomyces sp. NBC_01591 TaxID=2975888 RepID=UPI002DD8ABA9|nr:hypothetical protein [Streptomyces sp. NBC_01591]WSD66174.1 hypothetical protein OG978_01190 [Streptomyces sp. NBC_01591]